MSLNMNVMKCGMYQFNREWIQLLKFTYFQTAQNLIFNLSFHGTFQKIFSLHACNYATKCKINIESQQIVHCEKPAFNVTYYMIAEREGYPQRHA